MKKTLLIAAAALVAGIVSSEAQVYSANVVGYVNYVSQTNTPGFELIANPLDNGTNSLTSLFVSPPGGTQLQLWQPGGGFLVASYSLAGGGHWKTNGVIADATVLKPGQGVFIVVGGAKPYTNTFVGNVVPAAGAFTTNTVGSGFQLVASQTPYADYVTNAATLNLTGLAGGTQLQTWNPLSQSFSVYSYSLPAGVPTWKLNGVKTVPQLAVGQGFFLNFASGSYNWVQTLP